MRRRRLLAVIGSVGTATIAGCSGNGGGPSNGGSNTDNEGSSSGDYNEDSDDTPGGSEGTETSSEQQFDIGAVVWQRRDGNVQGTRAIDATGFTTDSFSSYTASISYPPAFTENAAIYGNQIHEKSTGAPVRQLPAQAATTPAIAGETTYFVTPSELVAADLTTGDEVWRYSLSAEGGQVIATEEVIMVELPESVVAVSASDGSQLWSVPHTSGPSNPIATIDGRLYAYDRAYNITDGSEVSSSPPLGGSSQLGPDGSVYKWSSIASELTKYSTDGSEEWTAGGTGTAWAADSDHVYTVGSDVVRAINSSDGSERWSSQVPTIRHPHPIAVGSERVYAASGGRLFALNKTSGEREAEYQANIDAVQGVQPAVGGGVVALCPASENASGPSKILVNES
jgi:hypothetical protein